MSLTLDLLGPAPTEKGTTRLFRLTTAHESFGHKTHAWPPLTPSFDNFNLNRPLGAIWQNVDQPPVSFVVVSYNDEATISDCLNSVLSQTLAPTEVILVDNDSTDHTADCAANWPDRVRLVRNSGNLGFGRAFNQGASHANGEYLATVNPDAILHPSWCSEMIKFLSRHPDCGATEGKILMAGDPSTLNSGGSFVNILGYGCARGNGSKDRVRQLPFPVSYPSGAAFMARRGLFQEVGGFDENYFLYHEDVDLGLRLQGAGKTVYCVPSAVAYHFYNPDLTRSKVRFLERNRWLTIAKNLPSDYFVRICPLLVPFEAAKSVYLARRGLSGAAARGFLDFIRLIPYTVGMRRRFDPQRTQKDYARMMTDDFPSLLTPMGHDFVFAQKVIAGYRRAFFNTRKKHESEPFGTVEGQPADK